MRSPSLAAAISIACILASQGALAINASALASASQSLQALLTNVQISTLSASSSIPTDRAALRSAVLAGKFTPRPDFSRTHCPVSCKNAGIDSGAWFVYSSVSRLEFCKQTMLLSFALSNHLDDPDTHVKIAACTADLELDNGTTSTLNGTQIKTCQPKSVEQVPVTTTLQLGSSGTASTTAVADVVAALEQLKAFSTLSEAGCNETINFAYSGTVALGVYVGSGLASQGVIVSVIEQLSTHIQSEGSVPEELLVQICDNRTARYSLGVFINTQTDLSSAQLAVQSFKNGSCLTTVETKPWQKITFLAPRLFLGNHSVAGNSTNSTRVNVLSDRFGRKLSARSDCTTAKVQSGDTCATLAAECGITAAEFTQYNPSSTECSSLAVGEYVCCSAGTLPDNTPSPGANGYCYSYLVQVGDSCSALAASYDITLDDIETYNAKTWGWNGCADLFAGDYICLSTGYPPMPANIPNAVCGPQVNNTATPPPGSDLTILNECPLNACCDIWGQCGTTDEFCTISNSTTGAPGTAAAGQNGCISNCGTSITTSSAPSEYYAIAYFEGWDWERACLTMGVDDIDTSLYTHIHFAFATINSDWSLNISTVASQFPLLVAMTGVKRILSIGGWSFSTDPSTYMIFRDVVSSESSREALVSNVVNFLNEYDLDGVDWDWEYPNEPDIPGIPAGTPADSTGFFLLLDELTNAIAANAAGKTVSITAPASYWYLKEFPILALSSVVDYIVFMTYDLHGQWDYGNAFSDPGCPEGGCLRSHVNLSETINALSMITKAGVPSNIIAAGVSSYGRSFEMSSAGCWTEECTFTGPLSGAIAGPCTDTAGYISDYEIDSIVSSNPSAEILWDETSYSNIMIYDSVQWVAYMNDSNKAVRQLLFQDLSFLGISDWAVDLQSEDGDSGSSNSSGGDTAYIDPGIWSSASLLVTATPGMTLIWPPMPLPTTTTISFPLWTTTVEYSSLTTLTSTLSSGVTSTYPYYIYVSIYTTISIPPVTTTEIPVWGVTLGTSTTGGPIYLTSSVQPPPFGITVTPVISGTTSILGDKSTSTVSGTTVVWGDFTYIDPPETETNGQSTTIIGGTTLPPTMITVTPNPHPTTVPGTTDPVLNTKPPNWTSGTTLKPTNKPGCIGCGTPCVLWCDPLCPFCPPGVTGNNNLGGEGKPDDSDSSTESESSTTSASYTVLYDTNLVDLYPTTFAAAADLSSLMTVDISIWDSMFGIGSTSTTTLPPTTTTVTVTPTQTPHVDCAFWDEDLIAYLFEIYNIEDWVTDGGASLKKQESGCGALTFWNWVPATDTSFAYVHFNLPTIIKAGCVERAIVSAGGPKISCVGMGVTGGPKRDLHGPLDERGIEFVGATYLPPTSEQLEALKADYANITGVEPYEPMYWSGSSNSSTTAVATSTPTA